MADPSCEIEVRVRYAETDPMGYLHHSRYAVYLEMGRTELLRAAGVNYRDLEAAGVFFVVAKMDVRFKSPARYDDMLVVSTHVERMTTARIDHGYTLTNKATGMVVVQAHTTLACVDATGRVIAIPDELTGPIAGS